MSYRCDNCNKTVPHGQPAHRIVRETAPCQYPYRKDAHRDGSDDPGGNGTRIVREQTVCDTCAV